MICIEDIFADIVQSTNQKLAEHNILASFQFGTLPEIVDNLNALTQAEANKYPLIALIEPFKQQKGIPNTESRLRLRLLIATYTQKELKADERLQLNFKPILFPVYNKLLQTIQQSEHFKTNHIRHTVINHFEIGRETLEGYDGTIFNDHIDAIEIQDMELDTKNKQCKIKNF